MIIKTTNLIDNELDYAVAKCEGGFYQGPSVRDSFWFWEGDPVRYSKGTPTYSTDWSLGGPIIERESISVIRFEDDHKVDANGFATSKRIPVWGACVGRNAFDKVYGSQGDDWGKAILIEPECVSYGPTLLIAAMRCLVASVLGDKVDVPDELCSQ
jgi:hypothetical protein